jgi:hypothetical protein
LILDWRPAEKDDRPLLQAFRCTTDAPKKPGRRADPHPRPWEYAVQKAIHQLPVPIHGDDGTCLIGLTEGERIGAVAVWCEMRDMPGLFKAQLIAVSIEFRGTSADPERAGAVASEALDLTLTAMASRHPRGRVVGLIDHRNHASQRLVQTHGFARISGYPELEPELEAWAARLPS